MSSRTSPSSAVSYVGTRHYAHASNLSTWGSSGLRVSVPILGTMGIGSKDWQSWVMEEDEGLEISKAAWDRGKYGVWNSTKMTN